jgi:hypothetical protein
MSNFSKMDKKKYLFVISNLNVGGGAEQSVLLIVNKLIKLGYDVELLTFYENRNTYNISPGVKVNSFNYKYRSFFLIKFLYLFFIFPLKMRRFLKKKKL